MKHKILFSLLLVMVSLLPGWSQITTMHATLSGIGIKSLNGLTAKTQTFATGTTGTDFNISSSGTVHTFNIPTASGTNRGLLSSADWTTFNNKFTLPAFTAGSVIISNGTTLVQDNADFFWNATDNRLGIGTNTPIGKLSIVTNSIGTTPDSTTGIRLINNTAAISGAQQSSPAIILRGNAYKTDATAGSQPIDFKLYVAGTQSTANARGDLVIQSGFNYGTYGDLLRLSSTGIWSMGTIRPGQGASLGTSNLQITGSATGAMVIASNPSGVIPMVTINGNNVDISAGNSQALYINHNFSPPSGSQSNAALEIAPIINQTGGANGTTYGLRINPTLTSAFNFIGLSVDAGTINVTKTITSPGTTGNQTINKLSGKVNIAAAGTTITVTNNLVTANSIVMCEVGTNDATATIKNVVEGAGSFVVTLDAACTAETVIKFFVIN